MPSADHGILGPNTAGVASLLLTTDCIIAEIKEKKDKIPAGGGVLRDVSQ